MSTSLRPDKPAAARSERQLLRRTPAALGSCQGAGWEPGAADCAVDDASVLGSRGPASRDGSPPGLHPRDGGRRRRRSRGHRRRSPRGPLDVAAARRLRAVRPRPARRAAPGRARRGGRLAGHPARGGRQPRERRDGARPADVPAVRRGRRPEPHPRRSPGPARADVPRAARVAGAAAPPRTGPRRGGDHCGEDSARPRSQGARAVRHRRAGRSVAGRRAADRARGRPRGLQGLARDAAGAAVGGVRGRTSGVGAGVGESLAAAPGRAPATGAPGGAPRHRRRHRTGGFLLGCAAHGRGGRRLRQVPLGGRRRRLRRTACREGAGGRLREAGYEVFRFTWDEAVHRPAVVEMRARRAFTRAKSRRAV